MGRTFSPPVVHPVSPDQVRMPVYKACVCPCGRPVLQPEIRGSGRPRKYYEDACRQAALRVRRELEAREAEQLRREQLQRERDAEQAAALAALEDRDVAEWVCIWRAAMGGGYQKLTARQVLAVRDKLQLDLGRLGHPLEQVRERARAEYLAEARRTLEGMHSHRALVGA